MTEIAAKIGGLDAGVRSTMMARAPSDSRPGWKLRRHGFDGDGDPRLGVEARVPGAVRLKTDRLGGQLSGPFPTDRRASRWFSRLLLALFSSGCLSRERTMRRGSDGTGLCHSRVGWLLLSGSVWRVALTGEPVCAIAHSPGSVWDRKGRQTGPVRPAYNSSLAGAQAGGCGEPVRP